MKSNFFTIGNLAFVVIGKGEEYELAPNNGLFVFHDSKPIRTASRWQLPAKCAIFGVASELDQLCEVEIMQLANVPIETTIEQLISASSAQLTSDKDVLFLKLLSAPPPVNNLLNE